MTIPLPMWLIRRIVKHNPWLLSTSGTVRRATTIRFLLWDINLGTEFSLPESVRQKLLKEKS